MMRGGGGEVMTRDGDEVGWVVVIWCGVMVRW